MEPDYYLQVGSAVAMLADNGGTPGDMDEPTFQWGIALFHRQVATKEGAAE